VLAHSVSDWQGTSHFPLAHTAKSFPVFATHSRLVLQPAKTHVDDDVSQWKNGSQSRSFVHLIWHLLLLHTLETDPVIGQSVSVVHSTHLPPTHEKPAPITLQLSTVPLSAGVQGCEHLPLSHENFEPSHTQSDW
jgi:hypothetical protein